MTTYIVYGIIIIAAVLFAGYLESLRAAQLIADHEQEKHKRKGPTPPNHVNCRSKLPPDYYTVPEVTEYEEELELMIQEAGKERPRIIRVPIDKNDLKARIEKLEDLLKAHKIEAKGKYGRLFKYVDHRLDQIEKQVNSNYDYLNTYIENVDRRLNNDKS